MPVPEEKTYEVFVRDWWRYESSRLVPYPGAPEEQLATGLSYGDALQMCGSYQSNFMSMSGGGSILKRMKVWEAARKTASQWRFMNSHVKSESEAREKADEHVVLHCPRCGVGGGRWTSVGGTREAIICDECGYRGPMDAEVFRK